MEDIKRYLTTSNELLLEKSLLHCHCHGVHSLVLHEEDGYLTRMFVTDNDHVLWKNGCGQTYKGWKPLTIAIHPHHCDIEIEIVNGFVWNAEFSVKRHTCRNKEEVKLNAFKWNTAIGGEGYFDLVGTETLIMNKFRTMFLGQKYYMCSNELHTVYVTPTQNAAWIIRESPATRGYDRTVYSNQDLQTWTPKGLYIKPTVNEIRDVLKLIKFDLYD